MKFSVPARINILGNPGDGNEGDFATISAAVEIRAFAEIEPASAFIFELETEIPLVYPTESNFPLPLDNSYALLLAAINRLHHFSPEFRQKCLEGGFRLRVRSDVPRQSGLGGSSLLVVLTLAALRAHYNLDPQKHNDYILAELTQRVEARELGITAGYADRYVPIFGGLGYLDYRGKLAQVDIRNEPLVTYERLDGFIPTLPLVAVSTGVRHNSGDVHGRMRPRYLEEHGAWAASGGAMPPMVQFMSEAWECAWRGKIALLEGDLPMFGALMNKNHHLVDEMMRYCGFEDGAGWANNLFIEVALENGALGAKLTGAGGGGSVFALVQPDDEQRVMQAWSKTAEARGLQDANIYKIEIAKSGLQVES